jgi:hypothetical protein
MNSLSSAPVPGLWGSSSSPSTYSPSGQSTQSSPGSVADPQSTADSFENNGAQASAAKQPGQTHIKNTAGQNAPAGQGTPASDPRIPQDDPGSNCPGGPPQTQDPGGNSPGGPPQTQDPGSNSPGGAPQTPDSGGNSPSDQTQDLGGNSPTGIPAPDTSLPPGYRDP